MRAHARKYIKVEKVKKKNLKNLKKFGNVKTSYILNLNLLINFHTASQGRTQKKRTNLYKVSSIYKIKKDKLPLFHSVLWALESVCAVRIVFTNDKRGIRSYIFTACIVVCRAVIM